MLTEWISRIPYLSAWGYVVAVLAAFLESLPAAGLFIPGQTVIVILGFLSQQGTLAFWPLVVLAAVGAYIGDSMAFFLGRRYGVDLLKNQSGLVTDVTDVLHHHPLKTLILSRFNSLTRAFAPFTAGAIGVRPRRFILANLVSSALWAVTWVLVGYLFGASYSLVSRRIDITVLVVALLLTVAFISYRYLGKQRLVSRHTTVLLLAFAGSLAIFLAILWSVTHAGFLPALDILVEGTVSGLRSPALTLVMIAATSLMQDVVITVLTVGAAGVLWSVRRYQYAVLLLVAVVTGALVDAIIKQLVLRPRPEASLVLTESFSFPSGHAMLAVIFFGSLYLTMRREPFWRPVYTAIALVLIGLVTASRVYLSAHWFSDALGGLAAGVCWLSFIFLCHQAYESYHENKRKRMYRA